MSGITEAALGYPTGRTSGANRLDSKQAQIFSEEFLLERPLLSALRHSAKSPVLLIDEVDRAMRNLKPFC